MMNKEEFVYLGCLIHSTTQSSPDISCHNVITCTVMQNLDSQIRKSRISISTKLKLYYTKDHICESLVNLHLHQAEAVLYLRSHL